MDKENVTILNKVSLTLKGKEVRKPIILNVGTNPEK